MQTYEIWIKNDPALNGRDCQCQIVTRATLEAREDWNSTPRTTDRDLCELNLKRLRRDNPAIADHYEIREALCCTSSASTSTA